MPKKTYTRKIYFLPNTSQARILLAIQIILAVIGLVASAILYIFLDRDLTANFFSAHITLQNVREMLFPSLFIINIVLLVMSGVINIFFSHRIAGPAYRISAVLKKIAKGDWTQKVFLRKGDYLQELAGALNATVDDTVSNLQRVENAFNELQKALEDDSKSKQSLDDLKVALEVFIISKEENNH